MKAAGIIGVSVLLALIGQTAVAADRTMRCAGRLVNAGDFEGDVIAKCGDPQHVETFEDFPGEWVSRYEEDDFGRFKAPYLLKSPIRKEIWTYQAGPNRLPYYLHFYKGRLIRIETGRRSGADAKRKPEGN